MKHVSKINHDQFVVCERCGETCEPGKAETAEHGIPRRVGWFCRGFFDCWARFRKQETEKQSTATVRVSR